MLQRKNDKGQFETVKKYEQNPMEGKSKKQIADAILSRFGHGWYQFFRTGSRKVPSVVYFRGDV